jgi:hypothetical protein
VNVDNLVWENVNTQFEQDYRATPTASSVIQKLQEIRQKENEKGLKYVSRCAKI